MRVLAASDVHGSHAAYKPLVRTTGHKRVDLPTLSWPCSNALPKDAEP